MKRGKDKAGAEPKAQLRSGNGHPFYAIGSYTPLGGRDAQLYTAMREALPILDAAVTKLVRLTGGFTVRCPDRRAETPIAAVSLHSELRTRPAGH